MNYLDPINPEQMGSISQSALKLGTLGAVMGGAISAIRNTYKVAKGEQNSTQAITNVTKETVGSGISTATAAAAMTALGLGGLIGIAGFAAVATITKGLLDSALYSENKKKAAEVPNEQ